MIVVQVIVFCADCDQLRAEYSSSCISTNDEGQPLYCIHLHHKAACCGRDLDGAANTNGAQSCETSDDINGVVIFLRGNHETQSNTCLMTGLLSWIDVLGQLMPVQEVSVQKLKKSCRDLQLLPAESPKHTDSEDHDDSVELYIDYNFPKPDKLVGLLPAASGEALGLRGNCNGTNSKRTPPA